MRIFLAGATGVIGRRLLPLLLAAGHEVCGTSRNEAGARQVAALGARAIVVDVYAREQLFAALASVRPDLLIHQLTDLSSRDYAANARLRIVGTRNLVDAALAVGVQRVIAQSIAFAYAPGNKPASEDDQLDVEAQPPRELVKGVLALEAAVAEAAAGVVLRYGLLYGPGTWFAQGGVKAVEARRGELAATDGVTSLLHVDDAAQAALLAIDWPPGVVNIVDDEPAPGTAWVPAFAAAVDAPPPPYQPGAARGERGAANAKARHKLGWQPRYSSWRSGFINGLE